MLNRPFVQSILGLKDCAGCHTVGLARGPRNPYYENCTGRGLGHKLGYIPQTENHAIARLLDRGEKLSARIVELKDKSDSWEWEWERVRFEVLLEKSSHQPGNVPLRETHGKRVG